MTKVVVYTAPNCGPCNMVKRWLIGNEIDFTEVSIVDNPKGYRSAPIISYDENEFFGYDLRKLMKLKGDYFAAIR